MCWKCFPEKWWTWGHFCFQAFAIPDPKIKPKQGFQHPTFGHDVHPESNAEVNVLADTKPMRSFFPCGKCPSANTPASVATAVSGVQVLPCEPEAERP